MRKAFIMTMVLALFVGYGIAAPVSVEQAQRVALKYMQGNFAKQVNNLTLAYTQTTESGMPALYIFNSEEGFVVVSADDVAQPILGYSEEGTMDPSDMPDGFAYYLRHYARQIAYAVENNLQPEEEVVAQWENVSRNGMLNGYRAMTAVPPLFNLSWNQDCYYNQLCPSASNAWFTCNHVYAGCVATAMSMVMKYWNWPDHGTGSHSYTPDGYPQQSANFETTYYDWNNMPASLSSGSSNTQKEAIARLMWHCGISVDMAYGVNGSGASSYYVPNALTTYFRYANVVDLRRRNEFTKTEWEDLLINSFDRGIPCYYSGSEGDAGHAFACLGYDNNRKLYFNWGWSGSSNGYYAVDALNTSNGTFNDNQSAIFNFIPDYIYNAMIPAPDDLSVEAVNVHSKTGVVSWTNPTVNMAGETIQNIDKVVLMRGTTQIFTQNNVTPGQTMTFQDQVSNYDCYTYTVYYEANGIKSEFAKTRYQYGPTCTWKVIGQTTNFQGWNGGRIQVVNSYGSVCDEVTMTSSTPVSMPLTVPQSNVTFKWVAPSTAVSSITINIKNSENTSVYSYQAGSSNNIPATLYSGSNDCSGCMPPTNLSGEYQWTSEGFGTLLTWSYDVDPHSFKVYRSEDGVNYSLLATVDKTLREYFDVTSAGDYYYKVTAFRSYCESTPAWVNDNLDYIHIAVTSIDENDGSCNVYPNPANAMLCVEAEGLKQIAIFNVMGQMVHQQQCCEDGVVVNTSDLTSGVYTVRIKAANGTVTRRFAVMH